MYPGVKVFFRQAPVPAIFTLLSALFFLFFFYLVTAYAVEPYYFEGLGFLLPFICYGILHKVTARKLIKKTTSNAISFVMALILSIPMVFLFLILAVHSATTEYNNPKFYERILKVNGYPQNYKIEHFPSTIPEDAKNILFHYNPAFLQGGEIFSLRFKAGSTDLAAYEKEFLKSCITLDSAASDNNFFENMFSYIGYDILPEDFTIYVFNSTPNKQGDWNLGRVSLSAISTLRREIIFYSHNW